MIPNTKIAMIALIVPIIGLLVAVVGLWLTLNRDRRSITKDRSERAQAIDLRLERLDVKMEAVWAAFTAQLLSVLHHPDPAKLIPDKLLRQYERSLAQPDAITSVELHELVRYMERVMTNSDIGLDERKAAEQLLRLLRHHPLWNPTGEQQTRLENLIGPDLHPMQIEKNE